MRLLIVLAAALVSATAARGANAPPATAPTMPTIAEKLVEHVDTLRIVLQYVGPTDKPAFPVVLFVGPPGATQPTTRPLPKTPYACRIPPALGQAIVERAAALGFFGDAHAISDADAVSSGGYALSFSAPDQVRWSRLITPAGARAFEDMVADLATRQEAEVNREVRRCLRRP